MKMSGNTVLITGGSSGIGLELASRFLDLDNTVIITGRDAAKLATAAKQLPKVHTVQSDAGSPQAVTALYTKVTQDFPALNVVINNAGIMRKINLNNKDVPNINQEIEINLMGPINIVHTFLPHLKSKSEAAIVNVSSGLAFVPLPISPVYSATKAALHSFTLSLRVQLKRSSVKVFELAPPGTETPLFRGDFTQEDLGGVKAMDVKVLGKHTMEGLRKDVWEIRPGPSNILRLMNRLAPDFIFAQLAKSADKMSTA